MKMLNVHRLLVVIEEQSSSDHTNNLTKKPAKVDVNEQPGVNAEEQYNNSEDTSPPRSTGSVDLSFLSYESQSVENRSTLVKKDSSDELLNEVIKVRSTQETILTDIKYEYIKRQLDQYLTLTQEIVSVLKNQNFTTLTAPENIPNFPLETENEFNLFKIYIKDQDKYSYMRSRCAAIGGSEVRQTTMNILKFLLTNDLAQKFNWAGKDKIAFKVTTTAGLIKEAVKLSFQGKEHPDLKDVTIENAIKDWLKLATNRVNYQLKKKSNVNY